jgi:hypothetical protein
MIGPTTRTQTTHELPAAAQLITLVVGKTSTQLIYVAAELGIADLLSAGRQHFHALAAATDTNPSALYRVLRALTTLGIFEEAPLGFFALTPLAEPLRTDAPDSVRQFAIFNGSDWHNRAWSNLLYSVKTGAPAFQHALGADLFAYLQQHPDQFEVFNGAMTAMGRQEVPALVHSLDWGAFHTVVDIGGGHGTFLAELLQAYPSLRGILFDLPDVAAGAQGPLQEAGVAERCTVVGGDFFQSVPSDGDAYVLKLILHDWDDDHARRILRTCRAAMGPGSTLLALDAVIPPPNLGFVAKVTDVEMLVLTPGGRERTAEELQQLLTDSHFALTDVIPTASRFSILVGRPN